GGVSCASAGFCAAVGSSWNGSNQRTLAERWDGSSWSIVTSADSDGTQDDYLTGVSCVSASFCAAVGYSSDGSGSRPLADGWDGNGWSIAPVQASATDDQYLMGVSCTSPTFCLTVG